MSLDSELLFDLLDCFGVSSVLSKKSVVSLDQDRLTRENQ